MMLPEAIDKRPYTPLAPVRLHRVSYAQKFLASFQYVPEARQKQSGYEQKQILRKECDEAAWLIKNKKYNPSLKILQLKNYFR